MMHLAVVNCSTSLVFATRHLRRFAPVLFLRQKKMDYQVNSGRRDSEVLRGTRDIIYTLDVAGNFTFLNQAAELISGYSCEEARRMNIAEMVAPEFAAHIGKQIKRHVRERVGAVYEIDIIAKNGRRVELEVSTHVVVRDGKPIEIHGIAVPSVVRNECPPPLRLRCVDASFGSASLVPGLIS